MNKEVINNGRKKCLDGTMKFPEFVQELINVGVERYTIDMVGLKAAYYSTDNEAYITDFEFEKLPVKANWDDDAMQKLISLALQGKTVWVEFLRDIAAAGCCQYDIFITGRKMLYVGRDGNHTLVQFPAHVAGGK